MPFLSTLAQNETQKSSAEIWTLVTDSISYDDNRYTKHGVLLHGYLEFYRTGINNHVNRWQKRLEFHIKTQSKFMNREIVF